MVEEMSNNDKWLPEAVTTPEIPIVTTVNGFRMINQAVHNSIVNDLAKKLEADRDKIASLQQQIADMQLKQKEVIEALDTLEAINLERINPRKNCFDDYTYQEMELRCASIDLSFCVKTIRSALGAKE